jgi:hypothetical protein
LRENPDLKTLEISKLFDLKQFGHFSKTEKPNENPRNMLKTKKIDRKTSQCMWACPKSGNGVCSRPSGADQCGL